jgi:hypothetical protein
MQTACCQTIADSFYELLTVLYQLARLDPTVKEKCSKNASRLWLLYHRICISGP